MKTDRQRHENDQQILGVNTELGQKRAFRKGEGKIGHHFGEHGKPRAQSVCAEEKLADHHEKPGAQDPEKTKETVFLPDAELCKQRRRKGGDDLPEKDQHKMVHPEKEKAPRRAMPQTVAHPDAKQRRAARQQRTEMIAQRRTDLRRELFKRLRHGQGIKDVVPEEGAEGDVPPGPEFGDAHREEGTGEVFGHFYPEELPMPVTASIAPEKSMYSWTV